MNIVVVVNRPERLKLATDTSVGLLHAAQDRGATAWVTTPGELSVVEGRPCAVARNVWLAPSRPAGGCTWTVADPGMRLDSPKRIDLDDVDATFMWAEPPLDDAYLTATFVLELVEGATVINDPRGLRGCSEHLLPLHVPALTPPTLVSADVVTLREFVAAHRVAVLKPVDGFSGHGVYRLTDGDPNLPSLLEAATAGGRRVVIAQRYLSEVENGNKRIFLIDGTPVGAVHRYPAEGDFRIGEPSAEAAISARDRLICAQLTPLLAAHRLRVAGVDVIGDYLIEVNITSPGALRKADALLGWSLCADLLDRALDVTPSTRRFA
jgi:glutathione synthase